MAEQADAGRILRRLTQLTSARSLHEQGWRECFDYSFPQRAHGLGGTLSTAQDTQQKKAKLLDSTGPEAANTLAAGLVSGLTPANAQWFELDTGDDRESEDRWLSETATKLWKLIHQSNFDQCAVEAMQDFVPAGWFVLYIDEAAEGGFAFELWPISSCFVSASKKGGRIDTIYRPFQLTVEQCIAEYGEDRCSTQVQAKFREGKLDERVDLVMAIEPRRAYRPGSRRSTELAWSSCHLEVATRQLLREGGYHEFPCVVPRWVLIPDTDYATGPYSDALPNVKTLNKLCENELAATDLAVAGMWIATDDGVLNPRAVKVGPRKVIAAASVDAMKPLLTGADFNVAWTEKAQLQAQIRRVLMADQLQPQDKPQMTAYEVHVRVQLIRQLLGPRFNRLQSEYLSPMIERCFGLAMRAGALGEAPATLVQRQYQVRYVSPLARAQKLESAGAIESLYATVGAIAAQKQDPSVWDVLDDDRAIHELAEAKGVPVKVLRDEKVVAALRDQRSKAQDQAVQQQQGHDMQMQVLKQGAPA